MNTHVLANYVWREIRDFEPSEIELDPQMVFSPALLLRSLIPLPQTVKNHLVIGLDFEYALMLPPAVPSPVPPLMPFFYLGVVDYATGEMLLPEFVAGGADSKVKVWGKPATKAGKKASGVHIPLGPYLPTSLDYRLKTEGKTNLLFGSGTVDMEGHHAVRLGEIGMNCTFIRVPTPTTSVISWPCGSLVLTGGPTALDVGAAVMTALDEFVSAFLGVLFPEKTFGMEYVKAYLVGIYGVCRDASIIAMTESDEQRADQAIEEKMMQIFTKVPLEALRVAALSIFKIAIPTE